MYCLPSRAWMRRKRFLGRHSLLDIRWNEVEVPDAVMRMTRMSIEDDDPVAQISGAARLWREPHPDTWCGPGGSRCPPPLAAQRHMPGPRLVSDAVAGCERDHDT